MIGVHDLPTPTFDDLARGGGDATTVGRLRSGQLSRRLLGLRVLLDLVRSAECEAWYAVLATAQDRDPGAVGRVLAEPHVGAWTAATLRAVRAGRPVRADLGRLGAMAVVAAAAAGMPAEVEVPVRDGAILLPGHGRASVPGRSRAVLRSDGRRLSVDDRPVPAAGQDAPGWKGLRIIQATAHGLSVRLCLDDLDPYRNCGQREPAGRLDPAEAAVWQRLLTEAWDVLATHHRSYAEAIAAGLTTVVPLRSLRADQGMNVTSDDAFGAVSLTRPADALGLALALVHEFQHAKLWALLDIVPLHRRDDEPRYYAPWRDDPRPLGGLLHGVYAFLAVTDFWRVQRRLLADGAAAAAEREFARWRAMVREAHRSLVGSAGFTAAGRRFLAGMGKTIEGFGAEPVDAIADAAARDSADDHRIGWRLRNLWPDPERIGSLAADWTAGRRPVDTAVPARIVRSDDGPLFRTGRQDLERLRLTQPDLFREVCEDPRRLPRVAPEACTADLAYVRGDHQAAVRGYLELIADGPDRVTAWTGLALAAGPTHPVAARVLADRPEVAYAVHAAVRLAGVAPPDPLRLADWLA